MNSDDIGGEQFGALRLLGERAQEVAEPVLVPRKRAGDRCGVTGYLLQGFKPPLLVAQFLDFRLAGAVDPALVDEAKITWSPRRDPGTCRARGRRRRRARAAPEVHPVHHRATAPTRPITSRLRRRRSRSPMMIQRIERQHTGQLIVASRAWQ